MMNCMKINVGSQNSVKVEAVKEAIRGYPFLANAKVGVSAPSSGISEQPCSLDETILGAMNRARGAFQECDYSFGIESGLMRVPHTKTGFMDVCVCAIHDGREYHLGLSSAFELPNSITAYMINEGLDMTQAFNKAKLTINPKLGEAEGAVGILTKGRVRRIDYTKQAITMALIHLEQSDLYI